MKNFVQAGRDTGSGLKYVEIERLSYPTGMTASQQNALNYTMKCHTGHVYVGRLTNIALHTERDTGPRCIRAGMKALQSHKIPVTSHHFRLHLATSIIVTL
jgi:hypothetical protein